MRKATEPEDVDRPRRRRGTREETENELIDAVLRLLERDGVLAGITLREVAKEAGVNHGQIYHYFGTRRGLLRAAITRLLEDNRPDPAKHWDRPFSDRRRALWRMALRQSDFIKLEALLALDEDPDLRIFPAVEATRAALDRDKETGALPPDADGEVMHALTAATYLGYGVFRETMARELGIEVTELDTRATHVFELMLAGLEQGRNTSTTGSQNI
ncbi:TetR/AcrR family transcriptional regulator [Prescottella defluvii]|uniref:TetR/AcrR family transcriptional regulator n=1 Tax=Prescottella defluvii TaxID=1323361 RepID=UPI000A9AB3A0|nr:TetR/AcrR family transcriptional regulator [Prescottella defluvii]